MHLRCTSIVLANHSSMLGPAGTRTCGTLRRRSMLSCCHAHAHPKPRASLNSSGKLAAYTNSFFGTQPRRTHVPPAPPTVSDAIAPNGISATPTRAPAEER